MLERINSLSDSSIEPSARLHDPFTEAEKELIDNIITELDTDDAKELELCKTKLVLAEQEIKILKAQLTKALHQIQLQEEASRNMLMHKKMIDLRDKLEVLDASYVETQKGSVKKDVQSVSPSSVYAKSSLFSASSDLNLHKNDITEDDRAVCFRMDSCGIL